MKPEAKKWADIADSDYDTSQYLSKGARHPQAVYFLLPGHFPNIV